MSKHTPGPWYKQDGMLYGSDHNPVVAAGLGLGLGGDSGDGVRNANAALIKSAPELLEALKGLLEVADFISENVPGAGWCMAQHKARAAINKAEGKHDPRTIQTHSRASRLIYPLAC